MPGPIIKDENLLRLCGSNNYVYAQIQMRPGIVHYKFLDGHDLGSDFIDLHMNFSCTEDAPQSDKGRLYAMYWKEDGTKDILRCQGATEVMSLNCPSNAAYFSVSEDYIIIMSGAGARLVGRDTTWLEVW